MRTYWLAVITFSIVFLAMAQGVAAENQSQCPNPIPLTGPLSATSSSREIVGAYCKVTPPNTLDCTAAAVEAGNACIGAATRACHTALPKPLIPTAAQTSTCTTYCQSSSSSCSPRIVIQPSPEVQSREYLASARAPFTHFFEGGGSQTIDLGVYTCSVALRLKGTCHCDPVKSVNGTMVISQDADPEMNV